MAIAFDGTNDRLNIATTVISEPLTIACWARDDDVGTSKAIAGLFDTAAGDGESWYLELNESGSFLVFANDAGSYTNASGGSYSSNTWHHLAGVYTSSSSRTAYLDGTAGTPNTTSTTITGIDELILGAEYAGGYNFGDCDVAEVGVWNVALSAAEISALANGASPLLIRPGALAHYAPLIRDPWVDRFSGVFTITDSPSAITHPRIIHPSQQVWVPPGAGVSGITIEVPLGPVW